MIHGSKPRDVVQPVDSKDHASDAANPNVAGETNKEKPRLKSVIAMTPDEEKAIKKQKDLDAINDALVAGERDPNSMMAIANQLDNPDKEVRTAAREAAVHLGSYRQPHSWAHQTSGRAGTGTS